MDYSYNFRCIAKNNVPPTVSKNFKLTVNFEPQIEVKNQVVGAPVGTNIVLRCDIQASPKPMTFWSKKSGMYVPQVLYLQWIVHECPYQIKYVFEFSRCQN